MQKVHVVYFLREDVVKEDRSGEILELRHKLMHSVQRDKLALDSELEPGGAMCARRA